MTSTGCTAIGFQSGQALTNATNSVFVGAQCGQSTSSGTDNTGVGWQALITNSTGANNCAFGRAALGTCNGNDNNAFGWNAMQALTSGTNNFSAGFQSLTSLLSGSGNIAIGHQAGINYTSSESNNILMSNLGTVSESGAIKIGTNGTHTSCVIQGISGVTVVGTAVLCSAGGTLGTIVSSIRYKENISDFPENVSVLGLGVKSFNFKSDKFKSTHYGLIAEDMDKNFPYLCFYNDKGQPESVKYHELCTFLLVEIQRLNKRIVALENK
jgi:hypothetical protein